MKVEIVRGWFRENWYFKIIAKNGKVVAESSKNYTTKRNCLKAVEFLTKLSDKTQIYEVYQND